MAWELMCVGGLSTSQVAFQSGLRKARTGACGRERSPGAVGKWVENFSPAGAPEETGGGGASVHPVPSSLHPLQSPSLLLPFPSGGPSWTPTLLYAPPSSGLGGWGMSLFQLLGECELAPQSGRIPCFPAGVCSPDLILRPGCLDTRAVTDWALVG